MTWEQKTIITVLPDEFQALATTAETVSTSLEAINDILNTAVALIKTFVLGGFDPFQALATALLDETQTLVDDTFSSGFFQLVITPDIVEGTKYDTTFGIKTLTPGEALKAAMAAFDDEGDTNRPTFTDSATVVGFGFLITVVSPSEFVTSIRGLTSVINLDQLNFTLNKLEKALEPRPLAEKSTLPDWDSVKLQNIKPFNELYVALNSYIALFRGYLTVADSSINDFLDALEAKVGSITDAVTKLNDSIQSITGGIGASGAYFLDIPLFTGGNTYLKAAIANEELSALTQNKHTAFVLYIAGGPSVPTLDFIKTFFE
ncbi:MAG TPA: hypothetical protein ENI23_00595 [bacterium]|nr:hypothetical protein [bacterium]